MRQAYDYWQDQPDSFLPSICLTDKARSATRLAVICSFVLTPDRILSAGIYHMQSQHRLARLDQESPDSITLQYTTNLSLQASSTDQLPKLPEVPAKTPLSQATLKVSELKLTTAEITAAPNLATNLAVGSSNHHCLKSLATSWIQTSLATLSIQHRPPSTYIESAKVSTSLYICF